MANTSRRRGFSPILAFIIGIFVGILLLIGGVVAAVFIALNYKLDNIGANKNDDGTYIFINADPNNGGAETVLDLFGKVSELITEEDLSLEKISGLFPIAESAASGMIDSLGQFIDVSYSDIKPLAFSKYGEFFQDKILDVRPAALLDMFGAGGITQGEFGEVINILLDGKEAEYVYSDGEQYPVYYDTYTLVEDKFVRADGAEILSSSKLVGYFTEKGGDYRIYFFRKDNVCYATMRLDGGEFIFTTDQYHYFDENEAELTGTYFVDNSGERGGPCPYVTLRTFADGKAFDSLNQVYITELLGNDGGLTDKILGDMTLGDLMSGADFESIINNLDIASFVDIDPNNHVMMYLAYGIKGVFDDGYGNYTGSYTTADGETVTCYIETQPNGEGLKVTNAYYYNSDGEMQTVPPTVVSEMNDKLQNITNELALSDLLTIKAPTQDDKNAIMIFLAFSVADVQEVEGENYSFVGKYYPPDGDGYTECYLITKGTEITDVYYYDNGVRKSVEKTSIAGVSSQVNRLTKTLRLKDIIEIDESKKFMVKLGEYTINSVQDAINELTLDDFIEVKLSEGGSDTSEVILSYVVYGLTDIKAESGTSEYGDEYTHRAVYHSLTEAEKEYGEYIDCFVNVAADGTVIEAFYYAGESKCVAGTAISDVSDRIKGVTEDITIGELLDVSDNKLLSAIGDSTISSLPEDINKLAINELYADSVYAPAAVDKDGNTVEEYSAKRYLTVENNGGVTVFTATADNYNADYVYYKLESGSYVLASTTGKLSRTDYDKLVQDGLYTLCSEDGLRIFFDTAYLYYTSGDGVKFTLVNTDDDDSTNDGKVTGYTAGLYTYGSANAMWKLLLCDTVDGEKTEKAYSVNSMTSLISNVTANTKSSTMRELHEAGIMVFDNEDDLGTQVVYDGNKTTIGELSLQQFVSFFVSVAKDPSILVRQSANG